MPSSGLRGPFSLTKANINKTVTKKCAGVYALGCSRKDRFHILYVGRSDSDVGDRLKDHLDEYEEFKFRYCQTKRDGFEKEFRLYHDFKPQDNDIHPDRPTGRNWECPICELFDE